MQKTVISLNIFLRKHKMKQTQFCRLCQIGRYSLHRYLRGHPMKPFIARRIEEKTQGALKASDLID